MGTLQIIYISMFFKVRDFGSSISGLLTSFPQLVAGFERLTQLITSITTINGEIEDLTKGKIEKRNKAKEALIAAILQLSGICQAYAFKMSDDNLFQIVDLTKSQLRSMRLAYLSERSGDILGTIRAKRESLHGLGITDDMISEAEERLVEYNQAQAEREQTYSQRNAKLKIMENLFKETRIFLDNDLDNQMLVFRDSHPEIYLEYQNTRKLKNYPATHEVKENPDGEGDN